MTDFHDRFSVRWLVVSYLMSAGGLMLATFVAAAADPYGEWFSPDGAARAGGPAGGTAAVAAQWIR